MTEIESHFAFISVHVTATVLAIKCIFMKCTHKVDTHFWSISDVKKRDTSQQQQQQPNKNTTKASNKNIGKRTVTKQKQKRRA